MPSIVWVEQLEDRLPISAKAPAKFQREAHVLVG